MQHVPREDVVGLLKQMLNIDAFFKFGLKLYSLDQNMNFRAQRHRKDIRLRAADEWTTKDQELNKYIVNDDILENLVEKTCEAVEMFGEDIPEYSSMYAHDIFANRDSTHLKSREAYEQARNKGLDNIAVTITDRVKWLRSWSAKKIKLV
ncbi:unnamed protein product [Pylaiella littoralis]